MDAASIASSESGTVSVHLATSGTSWEDGLTLEAGLESELEPRPQTEPQTEVGIGPDDADADDAATEETVTYVAQNPEGLASLYPRALATLQLESAPISRSSSCMTIEVPVEVRTNVAFR